MRELSYPSYSAPLPLRVSWSAVFAGASVSFVVMASLALLGSGIGFASAPSADTAKGLALGAGIGSGVWLLITGIASFYGGGWVAGRLTSMGRISDSVIHGLLSWTTATIVFFLLTSVVATGIVGSALGLIGANPRATETIRQTAGAQMGAEFGADGREMTPRQEERAETAAQTTGSIALFSFFILLGQAVASMYGARAGTRVIRLTPADEVLGGRKTTETSLR